MDFGPSRDRPASTGIGWRAPEKITKKCSTIPRYSSVAQLALPGSRHNSMADHTTRTPGAAAVDAATISAKSSITLAEGQSLVSWLSDRTYVNLREITTHNTTEAVIRAFQRSLERRNCELRNFGT